MLIGDPSYFPSRMVKPTGMVARSICIMDHPFNGTNNAESTQIIIPGRQASQFQFCTCGMAVVYTPVVCLWYAFGISVVLLCVRVCFCPTLRRTGNSKA